MDLGLSGKRVIITGGTRGIGRAIVASFVAEGAHVRTCARSAETTERLSADFAAGPGEVAGATLDIRDAGAVTAWINDTAQSWGGLDVVVSNVSARISAKGEALWRETFELDLLQHVRLSELTLPWLAKGSDPALIFVSSIAAVLTRLPPGEEAYGVAKAGLINYAGQLAETHGRTGLRVNTVSPGPIMFEGGVWDHIQQQQPALFQAAAQLSALKRHGTAEEVAATVAFLASPRASYITGANLRVDGGAVKTANF
jgi:3-oxoacyl-[acyl-carrier protein] reductase